MNFLALLILGFIFGIGFGYFVQRAGLCFAHGLGEIFLGKGKRIIRMFLLIFIITSIGFLISGFINKDLGLKTIGQIRGYGFYNLVSGIIFGAGILLNGGCILGTLRQIGEGNMTFLIVLISFIPGMLLVTKILNPLLSNNYFIQNKLLSDIIPVSSVWITLVLVLFSIWGFIRLNKKKKNR